MLQQQCRMRKIWQIAFKAFRKYIPGNRNAKFLCFQLPCAGNILTSNPDPLRFVGFVWGI